MSGAVWRPSSLSALHIRIVIFLPILFGKIAPALSDWMKIVGEQQFSSPATVLDRTELRGLTRTF